MPIQPSSVVVSSRESLQRNFVENGLNVFCQASFGAGAYAIGGTLLGFPPLTVPAALLTTGALLTALTICPSNANPNAIFGDPPLIAGGNCPTGYQVTTQGRISGGPFRESKFMRGPLKASNLPISPGVTNYRISSSDDASVISINLSESAGDGVATTVVRNDGLPDNCGDVGGSPGQIISNTTTGDTIDNSKVENNSNYNTVIPVLVNVGGINGTLNLNFGGIKIDSLFPLNFDMDIGGVRFKFGEDEDGNVRIKPSNPDKTSDDRKGEEFNQKLYDLIKEIKECACKPDVDMDMLFVPFATEETNCAIGTLDLLIPKGSVGPREVLSLQESAKLASEKCKENRIVQFEPSLITSATITRGGAEFFSPKIKKSVMSVRIKITGFNEAILPKITVYPDSNQRKFGSISYCLNGYQGGGDYIYVFDTDTYFPLPIRAKEGIIRVLFKPGTSFEIWDTGERIM